MSKIKPVPVPVVGQESAIKSLDDLVISVGNYRSRDYPPVKTSGIVVRGGKAQTKGKMARGPMA